ncbi:MAG: tetratricopeptide repeat protein [Gammaproteobacteria bacterium]|nr:tetratricopeptide repeat protein [Gammaproteobacteria bacterium]
MSLVNEMLQDLQQRKATGNRPLTGLRAVPDVAPREAPEALRTWWIVAGMLFSTAVIAAIWLRTAVGPETEPLLVAAIAAADTVRHEESLPIAGTRPQVPDAEPLTRPELKFPSLKMDTVFSAIAAEPATAGRAKLATVRMRPGRTARIAAAEKTASPRSAQSAVAATTVPVVAAATVTRVDVPRAIGLRRDGLAALRAGQPVEAEDRFRDLANIEPTSPESHLLLHAALRAQARAGAARTVLLAALEQVSEPVAIVRVLSHELLAEQRITQAVTLLQKYRPAGHSDPEYDAVLAVAYQRAGNHDDAVDIYRTLVASQPANGAWWVGLAISQEAKGLVDDARKSFATANLAGTLEAPLARYADERLKKLEAGS